MTMKQGRKMEIVIAIKLNILLSDKTYAQMAENETRRGKLLQKSERDLLCIIWQCN